MFVWSFPQWEWATDNLCQGLQSQSAILQVLVSGMFCTVGDVMFFFLCVVKSLFIFMLLFCGHSLLSQRHDRWTGETNRYHHETSPTDYLQLFLNIFLDLPVKQDVIKHVPVWVHFQNRRLNTGFIFCTY